MMSALPPESPRGGGGNIEPTTWIHDTEPFVWPQPSTRSRSQVDAWPQPSPEGPVAALDAEGSATRGHPPSRSWVLGNSRHGLRDPVLRQVQEDHPVRASHHPPGRQVASDLGTLGTLGTSLGRAGRIRQLLGALGAVLERVVRMWRDPPKGRSSPGSTGSNHAHDEARAKSRRHQGLQPGPLVADAAPSEAVRRKLVAITLPQWLRSWSVDANWIEDAAAAR